MSATFPDNGSAIKLRSAPARGYDTPEKAEYRRHVWDALEYEDWTMDGKVVLLPSSEGIEIEVALARGVSIDQIICVDKSAAVIATSKWRKRHPSIRFHACDIAGLGAKIAATEDRVGFANLDLCGQVSQDTIDQIRVFLQTCPFEDDACLAITVAKGREGRILSTLMRATRTSGPIPRCDRMRTLCFLCGIKSDETTTVTLLGEGSYVSGRHPMSWAVFRVRRFNVNDLYEEAGAAGVWDCLSDACLRAAGHIRKGKRSLVLGMEPCFSLDDSIWELAQTVEECSPLLAAPREMRRTVLEWFAFGGLDFEIPARDWLRIANQFRAERNRLRRPFRDRDASLAEDAKRLSPEGVAARAEGIANV